jgi:hypothetical protein
MPIAAGIHLRPPWAMTARNRPRKRSRRDRALNMEAEAQHDAAVDRDASLPDLAGLVLTFGLALREKNYPRV